jgi:hypothetical protein
MKKGKGAFFNRNNRKSGGGRKTKFLVGRISRPFLTIQCFEKRHSECLGKDSFFGIEKCECQCHV